MSGSESGVSNDKTNASNEALLMDHEYDGIQEFDNALPNWWLATFYGAIVFSIFYFGYYILGSGPSLVDEFQKAYTKNEIARVAAMAKRPLPTEQQLLALFAQPEEKAKGATIFQARCSSCHGAQGQGGIGPNLTDDYWLHGAKLSEIVKTVAFGVPEKGMPPWGSMMPPEEVNAVVIHVKTLKGTKPPNPKAPQGTLVAELKEAAANATATNATKE